MPPANTKFGTLQIIRTNNPIHHRYVPTLADLNGMTMEQLTATFAKSEEAKARSDLIHKIMKTNQLREQVERETKEMINPTPAQSKKKKVKKPSSKPERPPHKELPPAEEKGQEEDRLKLSRPRTTVKDGFTEMDFDVNGFSLSEDHLGEIADNVLKLVKKYRNLRYKSMRLIFQSSEDELRREDIQFLESAGELTREKILEKLENFLGRMIASTSAGFWILANVELNGE